MANANIHVTAKEFDKIKKNTESIGLIKQILNDFGKSIEFVRHIEQHLRTMPLLKGQKVCCKICNKDIDQIYIERLKK